MRFCILILISFFYAGSALGQDSASIRIGTITFKSSINYYVKFETTEYIKIGDTLFFNSDSMIPMVVINHISTTSCVGSKISVQAPSIGEKLLAKVFVFTQAQMEAQKAVQQKQNGPTSKTSPGPGSEQNKTLAKVKPKPKNITGRLTASSYSSLTEGQNNIINRYRYTFVFNAKRINDSKWAAESYLSFRHKAGDWQEVKSNLFSALKVYSLALKYNAGENAQIWIGRKVNLNASNIGAVDGIQYEKKVNHMIYGAILGSRPDYTDYGINFKLLQMGLYTGHSWKNKSGGDMTSTLAFFEQKNSMKTDRRFVYLQHTNTLLKNMMLFSSIEIDLFKVVENKPVSVFDPTSIYLSLRYKFNKKWVFSASYDALKNVIYYESYKSYIDQIIEKEVRQGLRFGFYFDPWKYVSIGGNIGYRFQADQKDPSRNADLYLSCYNIPVLKMSVTGTYTYLNTDYLKGNLAGVRMSKSLNQDKWSMDAGFRNVAYQYSGAEALLKQNILEFGLNCRLTQKFSISLNAENTFDPNRNYSTLYCNLMRRF